MFIKSNFKYSNVSVIEVGGEDLSFISSCLTYLNIFDSIMSSAHEIDLRCNKIPNIFSPVNTSIIN